MLPLLRLSISVVIYHPKLDDLTKLFQSYQVALRFLAKEYRLESQLIIVDNNPAGGDIDKVKPLLENCALNYQYKKSVKNGGYGYGHNQAITSIDSDYHIICNPDIEFFEATLAKAVAYIKNHPKVVLLTPAVFGQEGKRQYLCKRNPKLFHLFLRRFCSNIIKKVLFKNYLDRYEFRDKSYQEVIENVPFCTGCFMFFKTSALKALGGFDKRFFMYLEDADLSRRALNIGKTVYLPECKVIHRWERGSYKNKKLRNATIKSAFQYWWKWGGIW